MKSRLIVLVIVLVLGAMPVMANPINLANPGTISTLDLIDFNLVPVGSAVNFSGILDLDGASFAERFVGQTVTLTGQFSQFEILSPTASNPLTLQVGAAGSNLNIANPGPDSDAAFLLGKIPTSAGEGSIAVLFETDQSGLAFDFVGAGGGPGFLNFFARDGSLIDTLTLSSSTTPLGSVAFLREGDVPDIAGFSLSNEDFAGLGIDNLRFGVEPIPEPSTLLLLASGLAGLGFFRMRRKDRKNPSIT